MSALHARPVVAVTALTVALATLVAVGRPAEGSAPRPGASAPADWPMYHGDAARTGYAATMPTASGTPTVTHRITLDGAVYASPIVVKNQTIVATENNTVYRFGPLYHQGWKIHLGAPSPQSERPCGDIDPLGITGTPVYDYTYNVIYVAAELGNPVRHMLYAIDFDSGKVMWKRTLDFPGVNPAAMQERGAIAVSGNRVYVPFGGLSGDCGAYKGRVVGYNRDGSGSAIKYTVPTQREAGIWTPPGPTVDAYNHLYVSVGNGASGAGDPYDHSDSVLRLQGSTLHNDEYFSPTTWPSDNDNDLDLGSMGPALVAGKWILSVGKAGIAYVMNKDKLGGIGGELDTARICIGAYGGSAVVGQVVYVPCADGVRAVKVTNTPKLSVLWQSNSSITGSPVVGGGRVWTMNPSIGVLYGLDPSTGSAMSSVSVGDASRFATPAAYSNRLIIPTLAGITVVTTS